MRFTFVLHGAVPAPARHCRTVFERFVASSSLALTLVAMCAASAWAGPRALFDNTHAETAGNADWEIDTDQPAPVPDQSTITESTDRQIWLGAISSWGVDLVKRGYFVATLTSTFGITYGNGSNPYDLSNYDVFIVDEPNTRFSSADSTAIFNFVRDGGGLIAISDHDISDRNSDGFDSPRIWDLLDRQHFFGVHFDTTGEANNNISQDSGNVETASSDSIIHGPNGVADSVAYHNGTTMILYPAVNPTVTGDIWINGQAHGTTNVMVAHAVYGNGRIAWVGDSSPADDGSAAPGNSNIFDGWGEAGGRDSLVLQNATMWATRRASSVDWTPPTVTVTAPNGGEVWKAGSTHSITWTASDNVGVTSVDLAWSNDSGATYSHAIASGLGNSGSYAWSVPATLASSARVRVTAHDAAGNAGADASDANFTIDEWIISASAGPNGAIAPSGSIGVVQGASQAFTIAPNGCYQIAGVVADGASVGAVTSYTFANVQANHTIAATFALARFTIAASAGANGSISPSGAVSVNCGSDQTFSFTPVMGCIVASVTTDGQPQPPATSYTFVHVTSTHTISATFADTTSPAVAVTVPRPGEVWREGETHDIQWSASDNIGVDSIDVDVSTTGPVGPWQPVAHGLANSGDYAWTVPAAQTDSAVVRVTARDAAANAATAVSDSLFSIYPSTGSVPMVAPRFALERPAPNPSRETLRIRFSLARADRARVEIVDVAGRDVRELAYGRFEAGEHAVTWDGRDAAGSKIAPGIYLVELRSPAGERIARIVRL